MVFDALLELQSFASSASLKKSNQEKIFSHLFYFKKKKRKKKKRNYEIKTENRQGPMIK